MTSSFSICVLHLGFEGWFGGLSLRDFEAKDLQHVLGRVAFGHLLIGARSLCGMVSHLHLQKEGRTQISA